MQHIYSFPNKEYNKNTKFPLYILNCGYYKNVDMPIPVSRPNGRPDYQLILPISGSMLIDKKRVLPGEIFLYCPHAPQNYTYFEGEGTEYYWVHFYGCEADLLCADLSLENGIIKLGDGKQEVERLMRMIIRAFADRYTHVDEYAAGLLRSILAIIASPPVLSSPFTKAMKLLSDPSCNLTIAELATMYEMSEGHFIRSFKAYSGSSPSTFRTAKRLEIACEMLTSTKMTVDQISRAAGYSDPLYFSRIFKKIIGVSPKQYRTDNTVKSI